MVAIHIKAEGPFRDANADAMPLDPAKDGGADADRMDLGCHGGREWEIFYPAAREKCSLGERNHPDQHPPAMKHTQEALARNLRARIDASGMSARGVSLQAGLSEKAVAQILSKRSEHPRSDTLERIANVLGCTIGDLVGERRPLPVPVGRAAPVVASAGRDVPIFSREKLAAASDRLAHGAEPLGEPVAYAPRPPALVGSAHAFATYADASMAPWRRAGELVFLLPGRPVEDGCHALAVFRVANAPHAEIRHVRLARPDIVTLCAYSPADALDLPADRIDALCRVIEWQEALTG